MDARLVDVLVMAAGQGTRVGGTEPKQWLDVHGLPLFMYTAERLRTYGADSIFLVVRPDDVLRVRDCVAKRMEPSVYRVVAGGRDRQESVFLGLLHTTRQFVAIHDGARPFVSNTDVVQVIEAARRQGAATLAHPARDSLVRVDEQARLAESVPRANLWQVQTPQVALRDWLLEAHRKARALDTAATDDASVLKQAGFEVTIVRGSFENVKITEPEDLALLQALSAPLQSVLDEEGQRPCG